MALNEFEKFLDEQGPSSSNLAINEMATRDIQPDRETEIVQLADKLQVQRSFVRENLDAIKAKQEPNLMAYDKLSLETPRTALYLNDRDKYALSKDEIDSLSEIERSVQDHSKLSGLVSAGEALSSGLWSTYYNATQIPALAYDVAALPINATYKALGVDRQIRAPDWLRKNALSETLKQNSEAMRTAEMSYDILDEIKKGNYGRAGLGIAHSAIASAPSLMMSSVGYAAGMAKPALALAGAMSGAGEATQSAEQGIEPIQATIGAVAVGAAEAVGESLGTFKILKKWETDLSKQFGKATAKEVMKHVAKNLAYSSGVEGLEEAGTSLMQDAARSTTTDAGALEGAPGRALESFLVGGAMGFAGAPGAFSSAKYRYRQAAASRDAFVKLGEQVGQLKTLQRSPGDAQDFIDSVLDGTGLQTAFLPVEAATTYFQSKNMPVDKVMSELGVQESYNQALETGGDIEIPMSALTTKLSQELYQGLKDDVRFKPDGLSVKEFEQIKLEAEQVVADVAAESQGSQQTLFSAQARQFRSERKQIESMLFEQLSDTYTKADARVMSKQWANTYGLLAQRANQTPMQLFASKPLSIVKGDVVSGPGVLNQEMRPAPAMYSKLTRTIEEKMGGSQDVGSLKAMLREIKPEEMKWSGLDTFLEGKQKVTKAEVLEHLKANELQIVDVTKGAGAPTYSAQDLPAGFTLNEDTELSPTSDNRFTITDSDGAVVGKAFGRTEQEALVGFFENRDPGRRDSDTKFSQYTLPGGENYREVLFTLPPKEGDLVSEIKIEQNEDGEWDVKNESGRVIYTGTERTDAVAYRNELQREREVSGKGQFKSSHYDEANILAHVRLNDRTDADGKRVLFVEEIQSDWHQAGRKKGYKGSLKDVEIKQELGLWSAYIGDSLLTTADTSEQLNEKLKNNKIQEVIAGKNAVPDAPFRKTWHEYALKRIIRMAADGGYDRVAWTTGEQQAERYDLSKQIDRVTLTQSGDTEILRAFDKNDDEIMAKSEPSGFDWSDHIGKEAAQKLTDQKWGRKTSKGLRNKVLENADLKVGGEGMKGFYDKILVDAANKLGKKFGAKVGKTEIGGKPVAKDGGYEVNGVYYASLEDAKADMADQKVHSLEITPELKSAAINEGFTLFQPTRTDVPFPTPTIKRGSIEFRTDKVVITLPKNADRSTYQHEMAHLYLELLGDLAQAEATPQAVKDDYAKALKFLGVQSREEIGREQHEKFAEGFETYLMDGKAPTSELKSLFRKFKTWMLDVYKSVRELVPLNDEIRSVYDRMFVAEDEIQDIEDQRLPIEDMAAVLGETTANRLIELQPEARAAAEEVLTARLMDEELAKQKSEYKQALELATIQARNQVEAEPIYKVINAIQNDLNNTFYPTLKLNRDEAKRLLGPEAYKFLPRGITTSEGGMSVELASGLYGYADGTSFINEIAGAEDKETKIKRIAEEQVRQDFPDLYTSPELTEEAVRSYHNENKAEILEIEMRYLAERSNGLAKEVTRRMIARVPTRAQIKQQALEVLGNSTAANVKPASFLRAERKAASQAAKAFVAGDFEAAFEAKRREALSHEMYREALNIKERVDKDKAKWKRLFKKDEDLAKSRDIDLVNAARSVLAHNKFTSETRAAVDYLKSLKTYAEDQYLALEPLIQQSTIPGVDRSNMTVDQYVAMSDTVDALWSLSKENKTVEINGQKKSLDDIAQSIVTQFDNAGIEPAETTGRRSTTEDDKKANFLLGFKSALTRVEAWTASIDLSNPDKPLTSSLFDPIKDISLVYRGEKLKYLNKFKENLQGIKQGLNERQGPFLASEINWSFNNKAEIIAAMLHSGNESNLSKLVGGYEWGAVLEDGTVDTSQFTAFLNRMAQEGVITKADWDFVQSTWDLLEEIKPLAQKTHKKLYGFYFSEITASSVQTPFGEYKGGYFPAKADPIKVREQSQRIEAENLLENNNSFAFPTTGRGATMKRVENYRVPLSLDLNQTATHIDWVLRFSYLQPAVHQAARVLNKKEVKSAFTKYQPTIVESTLTPWLQRVAKQQIATPSGDEGSKAVARIYSWARSAAGPQIMFANVSNTLQQLTGLIVAAAKVSPAKLASSTVRFMMSPQKTSQTISELSPFMAQRLDDQLFEMSKEIDDIVSDKSMLGSVQDWANRHTYFMQQAMQNVVDNIVWQAAYDQSAEILTHEQALRDADAAVRLTQGSMGVEDVSAFEAGNPMLRAFSMFYSYFNMQANLMGSEFAKITRDAGIKNKSSRMLYVYMMGFALPAAVASSLARLMAGEIDPDDDDFAEQMLLDTLIISQVKGVAGLVPVLGPFVAAGVNRFNDKIYDDKVSLSPAMSILEAGAGAPFSIYEAVVNGKNEKRAIRDTFTLLGLASGLPILPLAKPIGYMLDVESGKANPSNPLEFTRGLVTGRSGESNR